ncbi:MAG: competence protein [Flavobacterium sp.]|nr:competence protein [Flavobacterium sp.]
MAFEELKENTDAVQENAKKYIEGSLAYYKLWGFKVAMKSTTLILKFSLIVFCFAFVLFFLSISGAFALGKMFNNYAIGFLIIAGIYFVLGLLVFLIKDKSIEKPILEKFSDIFFNN